MKIAILGGSFDPIHLGHLSIARAAMEELDLDRVLLMPARVSPFKQGKKRASDRDRIVMAELAAKTMDGAVVSTWEMDREQVSYTFDTLDILSREHPENAYVFLMGTDSFLQLDTWYRGEEMLRRFTFGLAPRPGFRAEEYEEKLEGYRARYGAHVTVLKNEPVPVSSTEIRARAAEGKSLEGMVPKSVEQYIYEHKLYQKVSGTAPLGEA